MLPRIVLGFVTGCLYLVMAYHLKHIVANIREDPETSLSMFFLKNSPDKAFKIFAISTFALTLLLTIEIYAFIFAMPMLAEITVLLLALPPMGFLYFFKSIYDATGGNE